jgi:hypothetical protein
MRDIANHVGQSELSNDLFSLWLEYEEGLVLYVHVIRTCSTKMLLHCRYLIGGGGSERSRQGDDVEINRYQVLLVALNCSLR